MVPCMRSLFLAVVLSAMGTTAGVCGQYEPGSPEDIAERTYVIGPDAARRIGYRIDWQVPSPDQEPILDTVVEDTAVFTLDTRNLLSRYDRLNAVALERLRQGTTQVEFYGDAILKEAQSATADLLADSARADVGFNSLYSAWQDFRQVARGWNQVTELSYSRFSDGA